MGRSQIWDGTEWVSMTGGVGEDGGDADDTYLRLDGSNNNVAPSNWLRQADANALYLGLSGIAASAYKWATARTITFGTDLSGSVTLDGSGNVTAYLSVVNDSHTHDTRYYTEGEIDATFLRLSGGTVSGTLNAGGAFYMHNGGYVYNYNAAPPSGSQIYNAQVRNSTMSDQDPGTYAGIKDGDIWIKYSWS